ncbi:bacteriocin maturation protein [Paenibacillus filicis]|uniref:Bacteriocin maturation protein n=1 Tax=Paenibacillus filicis TaxID=669464 RepID=A0ABU9DXX3_9BACL
MSNPNDDTFLPSGSHPHPYDLAQIRFLDSFGPSGASLFETYRRSRVLAAGSGTFLLALATSLLESGLSNLDVLVTEPDQTDRKQLTELAKRVRPWDPVAGVEIAVLEQPDIHGLQASLRPFDLILYASMDENASELVRFQDACLAAGKVLIPALLTDRYGLAGPVVSPESPHDWESAWFRVHETALAGNCTTTVPCPATAEKLLSAIVVFEGLKVTTQVMEPEGRGQLYVLDPVTCEGSWHRFDPHPAVRGITAARLIIDLDHRLNVPYGTGDEWWSFLQRLTSPVMGVFHFWDEGLLSQLPLAQCRVQPADPLTRGPAGLLPELTGVGLTHEEARREAGLLGAEAYVSRMTGAITGMTRPGNGQEHGYAGPPLVFTSIGAGTTPAEGIGRGIQTWLQQELADRLQAGPSRAQLLELDFVEDEVCRYELQALIHLYGTPVIARCEDLHGFPVIGVGTGGTWFASPGLHLTLALRRALQLALEYASSPASSSSVLRRQSAGLVLEEERHALTVPAWQQTQLTETVRHALQVLEQHQRSLAVFEINLEPFVPGEPVEVFGLQIKEVPSL